MRRTEINQLIKDAEHFFDKYSFKLPPFAAWTLDDWKKHCHGEEIFACGLGWDVTDFGHGDFMKEGLLLFTLRNGLLNSRNYAKNLMPKKS